MIESKKGEIEKQSEELLKSPYIFEFAGLKENKKQKVNMKNTKLYKIKNLFLILINY